MKVAPCTRPLYSMPWLEVTMPDPNIQDYILQLNNAESVRKVSESLFCAYLDNSLAPAWIYDEDGCAIYMNKLAKQIWRIDETYRYKHMNELFPKRHADQFLASDKAVLETNRAISL